MNARPLVNYLRLKDAAVVTELAARYPESKDLFAPGIELGEGNAVNAERAAKLALVQQGVDRLGPELDAIATALRARLQAVRRLRLIGGLIAAAGGVVGASLVLAAKGLAWPKEATTLGVSFTSMLGGVCTVLAGYWETSPIGKRVDAVQELGQLGDFRVALESARIRLRNDVAFPLSGSDLDALIQELDNTSLKVLRLAF